MNKTEEANDERHYILITYSHYYSIFGVYFRFAEPGTRPRIGL